MSDMKELQHMRSSSVLLSFIRYCINHPEERFWQALRNWANVPYIFIGDHLGSEVQGGRDTFYFTQKEQ